MLLARLRRAAVCVLGISLVLAANASGQNSPRPLDHQDFDTWCSINTPLLSANGQWLAYSFMPQDADGDLVLREVSTGRELRVPVGAYPPPPATPADEATPPEAPPPLRNIRIAFTHDGRFVVATTHPSKAEISAARKAHAKPEQMPKGGLVTVNLGSGAVTRVADVKSFQVPAKGPAFVAYLKEAAPEDRKPEAGEGKSDASSDAAARRSSIATSATKTGTPSYGAELTLLDLDAGTQRSFAAVTDYSLARDGKTLLYAVSSKTNSENGVYEVTPGDAAAPHALLSGRGRYSRLAWDREQTQAAFVSDRDTASGPRAAARFKLYHWQRGATTATPLVTAATPGLPSQLTVSNNAAPSFSRDGSRLYVATATAPKPPKSPDAAVDDSNKVTADLWHWRDGHVQPMQKSRAVQERNRTYRGVFDLAARTYVQLADPTMATVTTSDDGTRVLGYDDRAYRHMVDYDGRFTDVYVIDAKTGERKLARRQLRSEGGALQWSPDGKWANYFQDRQWHLLDTATGTTRVATAKIRVPLHNELHDRPEPPGSYGSAGWVRDSSSFVVYDRYDAWQVFVDARPPKNLTAGAGRAQKIQFRVQGIEPVDEDDDERGLDPNRPLVLRGESEETRASGLFRTRFAANVGPERLLWDDRNFRYVGRAHDADALLLTASRFDQFPDVQVTDANFAAPRKLTNGGAQLAAFTWGSAELISFRSADGVPLKATLYKPVNPDRTGKYPLIVYIYERLSQNVHNFVPPAPGTNINVSYYVSNGYCVLMPDIVYKTGQPGQSAVRCVLPAIDAAVARGFIDEKAIGIQGHSWGGYQVAYLMTQTSRFRAAEAGAPVGNMTSAYSGIRWGSGLPRQFQYETGQSRIGGSLQSATRAFLENSPVFHVQRVTTPLLILANDQDDAVPWYQGIELFLALRRYGKQAWMFNYNGEFHGLRRRPDQKDWTRRMQQFFDHHLKGAPAPKWLEEGVPYLERDEEKERFNAPATAEKTEPVAALP